MRLGSVSDVARDQQVTKSAVEQWIRRHQDAPRSVQVAAGARLYDLDEWGVWCDVKGLGKR